MSKVFHIFIIFCFLAASLACGNGGSEILPDTRVDLSGNIIDPDGVLSKAGRSASIKNYRVQLWTVEGQLLEEKVSTDGSFSFKAEAGKIYVLKAVSSTGSVLEALTSTVQGASKQDVSVDTTVEAALIRKLYPNYGKDPQDDQKKVMVGQLLSDSSGTHTTWILALKQQVLSRQSIDEAFWTQSTSVVWSQALGEIKTALDAGRLPTSVTTSPGLPTEETFVINAKVSTPEGAPIVGVQVVSHAGGSVLAESDGEGVVLIPGLNRGLHQLRFLKSGYSEGYQQVWLGDGGVDDGKTLILPRASGEAAESLVSMTKGQVSVQMKPKRSVSLNASKSITLGKANQPLSLRYSSKGGQAYAIVKNKRGKPVWRQKYAGASLSFSTVDPSSEMGAMPGALVTKALSDGIQSKPRLAADGSEAEDALVSVSMMDLNLRDASNQKIDLEPGDHLESYVKLPAAEQSKYRDLYEAGDRVVPFYSFNEAEGRWVLENEAELVLIGDTMYGRAKVTHFSWWNLDYPEKRTRVEGKVYKDHEKTMPLAGVKVEIEAIGSNHSTKVYTDDLGSYSLLVLRNTTYRLRASLNGVKTPWVEVVVGNNPETTPYGVDDIVMAFKTLKGVVKDALGQPLKRALIRMPDGSGVYSNDQGQYAVEVMAAQRLDLRAQYHDKASDTSFVEDVVLSQEELAVAEPSKDIVIDLNNVLSVSGVVSVVRNGVQEVLEGATIYTTAGGAKAVSKADGSYVLPISKSISSLSRSSDTLFVPLRVFYYNAQDRSYPSMDLDLSIRLDANAYIQNISFQEGQKVLVKGTVLLDGLAVVATEVMSDAGQVTSTDSKGEFCFEAYPGQSMSISAKIVDDAGQTQRKTRSIEVFAFEDGQGGIATNRIDHFEFVSQTASIVGKIVLQADDGTQKPISGIRVQSPQCKSFAVSSDTGEYLLKVLPNDKGKATLNFRYRKERLEAQSVELSMTSGEQIQHDVVLSSTDISNPSPVLDQVEVSSYRVASHGNVTIRLVSSDPDQAVEDVGASVALENLKLDLSPFGRAGGNITSLGEAIVEQGKVVQSFLYTPELSFTGWASLRATARDRAENVTTQTIGIEVLPEIVNKEPTVLGLEAPSTVSKTGEYLVKMAAWDEDGDPLDYSFSVSPEAQGVSFIQRSVRGKAYRGKSQVLNNARILKLENAAGRYTISVSCSDGSQTVVETQIIDVINEPPQIRDFSPSVEVVTYGQPPVNYSLRAIDSDSETLNYAWSYVVQKAGEATPQDGDFVVMPKENLKHGDTQFQFNTNRLLEASTDAQDFYLKVAVSDGENTVFKMMKITVLPKGVKAEKKVQQLLVEATSGAIDDPNAVYTSLLSGLRFNESAHYRLKLVYNTGEEESVTQLAQVSGQGEHSVLVDASTGTLTMKGEGTHVLNFSLEHNGESFESDLVVEVEPLMLSGLWLSATSWVVTVGESFQALVEAVFEDQSREDVTSSSNTQYLALTPNIASIDATGLVTGRNVGEGKIQVSHFDLESQTEESVQQSVDVRPVKVSELNINPSEMNLMVGDAVTPYEIELLYNNGHTETLDRRDAIQWISDPSVAILNGGHDVVPVGAGNAWLQVEYKENDILVSDNILIEVSMPSPKIVRLEVFPEDFECQPGVEQQMSLWAVYNTGHKELLQEPEVNISGDSVSIDENLVLKALQLGTSEVVFQVGEAEVTSRVEVVPAPEEFNIEQMAQLGGAVYSSHVVKKPLGHQEADILVYNKGRSLASVDVSDPEQRQELSQIFMDGWVSDFQLDDRFINVVQWHGGYSMVTFDNPARLERPQGYGTRLEGYAGKIRTYTYDKGDSLARYALVSTQKRWTRYGRTGINGLVILDVTNPLNVVKVGQLSLSGTISDVMVVDDHVYVSNRAAWNYDRSVRRWVYGGYEGFRVVDISDLSAPRLAKEVSLTGYSDGMAHRDGRLYIGADQEASWKSELLEFDISDPEEPSLISSLTIDARRIGSIQASGNGLYLSMRSNGIGHVDLTGGEMTFVDSWTPAPANWATADDGEEDMSGGYSTYVYDFKIHEGFAYIANGRNGMSIYKMEGEALGSPIKGYPNLHYVSDVLRLKDFTLISSGRGGIVNFSGEDLTDPKVVSGFESEDYSIYRMCYDEATDTIFASAYHKHYYWWWGYFGQDKEDDPYVVMALKLDEDGNIREVSRQSAPASVQDIVFSEGRLYLSAIDYSYRENNRYAQGFVSSYEWDGDTLLDLDTWTVPHGRLVYENSYYSSDYSSRAYGLEVAKGRLYVATPAGIVILDQKEDQLVEQRWMKTSEITMNPWSRYFYASRIQSYGDGKFLVMPTWYGLLVYAVRDSGELEMLSRMRRRWYSDIRFNNGFALATGSEELLMLDMRDPMTPRETFSANLNGWSQALDWQDDLAVVASGLEGITFYKVTANAGNLNASPLILGDDLQLKLGEEHEQEVFMYDHEGGDLELSVVQAPKAGSLSLSETGYHYVASSQFVAYEDSFRLAVDDGSQQRVADYQVEILHKNTAPQFVFGSGNVLRLIEDDTVDQHWIPYEMVDVESDVQWAQVSGTGLNSPRSITTSENGFWYGAPEIERGEIGKLFFEANDGEHKTATHLSLEWSWAPDIEFQELLTMEQGGELPFYFDIVSGEDLSRLTIGAQLEPFDVDHGLSLDRIAGNVFKISASANAVSSQLLLQVQGEDGARSLERASVVVLPTPFVELSTEYLTIAANAMGNIVASLGDYAFSANCQLNVVQTSGTPVAAMAVNRESDQSWIIAVQAPAASSVMTFDVMLTTAANQTRKSLLEITSTSHAIATLAENDVLVSRGQTVHLLGGASHADGKVISYAWTVMDGLELTLENANTNEVSFVVPNLDIHEMRLLLTVSDGSSSTNIIQHLNLNQVPIADAGQDQTVVVSSLVTLSGGESVDPEGATLTYEWQQAAGPEVGMSDVSSNVLSFVAPSTPSELEFTLTVSDGLEQHSDVVRVMVMEPQVDASSILTRDMDVGGWHFLLLDGDTLLGAGFNTDGEFGRGDGYFESGLVVSQANGVVELAAGYTFSLMVKDDGSLWATGFHRFRSEGEDFSETSLVWEKIVAGNVQSVNASFTHSLVLKTDGRLWSFGQNDHGQLGIGTNVQTPGLVETALGNVVYTSSGFEFSMAMDDQGQLWGFGRNDAEQLGLGDNQSRWSPELVVPSDVVKVSCGAAHTLVLKADGSLWAFGNNDYGQLGTGSNVSMSTPTMIVPSNVIDIAAGMNQSFYVLNDGSLWGMGLGGGFEFPEVGVFSGEPLMSPILLLPFDVVKIAANEYGLLFKMRDGRVSFRSINGHHDSPDFAGGLFSSLNMNGEVLETDGGRAHGLMLTTRGRVFTSGNNLYGLQDSSEASPNGGFVWTGLEGIKAISAGSDHSLFLTEQGDVLAEGLNEHGQLGSGNLISSSNALRVFSAATNISAGGSHSMLVDESGTLWVTGNNAFGQLGSGNSDSQTVFTASTMSSNVVDISAGRSHSLCVLDDGSVWGAGWNAFGQLGTGNLVSSANFIPLMASGASKVYAGGSFSMVLKKDGSLWMSGDFADPITGQGNSDNSAFRMMSLANVLDVAVGDAHALISTLNGLYVVGLNQWGQCGLGHLEPVAFPVWNDMLLNFGPMTDYGIGAGENFSFVYDDMTKDWFGFGDNREQQWSIYINEVISIPEPVTWNWKVQPLGGEPLPSPEPPPIP